MPLTLQELPAARGRIQDFHVKVVSSAVPSGERKFVAPVQDDTGECLLRFDNNVVGPDKIVANLDLVVSGTVVYVEGVVHIEADSVFIGQVRAAKTKLKDPLCSTSALVHVCGAVILWPSIQGLLCFHLTKPTLLEIPFPAVKVNAPGTERQAACRAVRQVAGPGALAFRLLHTPPVSKILPPLPDASSPGIATAAHLYIGMVEDETHAATLGDSSAGRFVPAFELLNTLASTSWKLVMDQVKDHLMSATLLGLIPSLAAPLAYAAAAAGAKSVPPADAPPADATPADAPPTNAPPTACDLPLTGALSTEKSRNETKRAPTESSASSKQAGKKKAEATLSTSHLTLPVTLVSAFPGAQAAKDTLLQDVLQNSEGLRCALVSKSAARNEDEIDSAKCSGTIVKPYEEDLPAQLTELVWGKTFDCLVIDHDFQDLEELVEVGYLVEDTGEKSATAKLDTFVVVVDAESFLEDMRSLQTHENFSPKYEEDECYTVEALMDHIEIADVVVITNTSEPDQLTTLKAFLNLVNPTATLVGMDVPLNVITRTGRFSVEKAEKTSNWLLAAQSTSRPTDPLCAFVYKARAPFHPQRLFDFLSEHFELAFEDPHDHEHSGHEEDSTNSSAEPKESNSSSNSAPLAGKSLWTCGWSACGVGMPMFEMAETRDAVQPARVKDVPPFGQILLSKGHFWLATRNDLRGDWSQAGSVVRADCRGAWYAAMPEEHWPKDPARVAQIKHDFDPSVGDRRQEIVFLGIALDSNLLGSMLDSCLMRPEEAVPSKDPFSEWPALQEYLNNREPEDLDIQTESVNGDEPGSEDDTEDDECEQETSTAHRSTNHKAALLDLQCVQRVKNGVVEMQEMFTSLEEENGYESVLVIVHWLAHWHADSKAAQAPFAQLCHDFPTVMFAEVGVESSAANKELALQRVLISAAARIGQRTYPAPRADGTRWPLFTLYRSCDMFTPLANLSGIQGDVHLSKLRKLLSSFLPKPESLDNMVVVSKGAKEFKEVLQNAKTPARLVVVSWVCCAAPECEPVIALIPQLAARYPEVVFVEVDPDSSEGNAKLAGALQVKAYPTIHMFLNMQRVGGLSGVQLENDVIEQTINKLCPQPAVLTPNNSQSSAVSTEGASLPGNNKQENGSSPSTSTAKTLKSLGAELGSTDISDQSFDPPAGKINARGGSVKRLFPGKGKGLYHPKMPCLQCGCPWWLGDDWDATCARCGWCAESEGYDDDSIPLPEFKEKWTSYRRQILAGKTAAYSK